MHNDSKYRNVANNSKTVKKHFVV